MPSRFKKINFYTNVTMVEKIEKQISELKSSSENNIERLIDYLNIVAHNFKPFEESFKVFSRPLLLGAIKKAEDKGYILTDKIQNFVNGYFIEADWLAEKNRKREEKLHSPETIQKRKETRQQHESLGDESDTESKPKRGRPKVVPGTGSMRRLNKDVIQAQLEGLTDREIYKRLNSFNTGNIADGE